MTVTPSQSDSWRRMWDLFQSALEEEGSERDAFLEEACAGDDALKQQVSSLLRADVAEEWTGVESARRKHYPGPG